MSWHKRHPELVGVGLILFSIVQSVALCSFRATSQGINLLGLFGHYSALIFYKAFGMAAFPLMLALLFVGIKLVLSYEYTTKKVIAFSLAFFSFCLGLTLLSATVPRIEALFSMFFGFIEAESSFYLGGAIALFIYKKLPYINLERLLNFTGTALLSFTCFTLSVGYLFEARLQDLLEWAKEKFYNWKEEKESVKKEVVNEPKTKKKLPSWNTPDEVSPLEKKQVFHSERLPSLLARSIELPPSFDNIPETLSLRLKKEEIPATFDLDIDVVEPAHDAPIQAQKQLVPYKTASKGSKSYKLPSIELLNPPKKSDTSLLKKELKQKAELLEETLLSFGIEAKVGQIYSGPTITSFEVHPAIGVKVGRIRTLENDIALNMEAKSIRIIAPIPGKAAVGIEVPNKHPQEVCFKELLAAYQQQGTKFHIPMLLGKTVSGEFVMYDLAKMPHCIIAGATGSGKSVCINSIVMSILMTATPDEVRLLMVDPKKVELTSYSDLPHMLAPVITEPKTACIALNWLVKEMEKRYEMLKFTQQRNIEAFNQRKIDKEAEAASGMEIPERLAYYVAIIDELADLMMVASSDIETPITRIAQMARAVGIHLILATQRPSREVITGLIKANFPARISFKVASRINSQIILDEVGAETLLGYGDMLFLTPGTSQLVRAQGVFIRDDEINRTIEQISKQLPPQYIISSFDRLADEALNANLENDGPRDELYEDAKSVVLATGNASTTFLQRKLKVGYARAASLMDELEKMGVVGPQEGAKPRKIFFPKMSDVLAEDFDT